jgi:hypothetical protein
MTATSTHNPDRPTAASSTSQRAFTVAQLAERWLVKQHVVLACIKAGDLKALDISAPGSKRPHWRIMPEELAAFERRRTATPIQPAPRRRKKEPAARPSLIDPTTGKISRQYRAVGSIATGGTR